jgi:two-component system sensor histidine kinase YesM
MGRMPMANLMKIRWKLVTFILLSFVVLLPVVFQGYLIGRESTGKIETLYNTSVSKTLESLVIQLSSELDYLEDFSRTLSFDDILLLKLTSATDSTRVSVINDRLKMFNASYKLRLPVDVMIVSQDGEVFGSQPLHDSDAQALKRVLISLPWRSDNVAYNKNVIYEDISKDFRSPDENMLYVTKNIVANNEHLGLLVIGISSYLIQRLLSQGQIEPSTGVFIMDQNSEVLLANEESGDDAKKLAAKADLNSSRLGTSSGGLHFAWEGKDYLSYYYSFPNVPWRILSVTPKDNIFMESKAVWNYTFLMMGISLFVILVFMLIFIQKITLPILRLSKQVRKFRMDGKFDNTTYRGIDEIEILSFGINQMVQRIRNQIDQLKQDENEKREFELHLLQSQIRPHFLHNALNTVRWMAEMKGERSIADALRSLSGMMNYTLSKTLTIWSRITDELKYTQEYISFQQLRMAHPVKVSIQTDDRTLQAKIPKLSLQPIVENALIHGFVLLDDRSPELHIEVGLVDGRISVSVEDNGVGMNLKTTESILDTSMRRSSHTSSGIGMLNIDRRLKLEFGNKYRMHIESQIGKGTRVVLLFPFIPEGEDVNETHDRGR